MCIKLISIALLAALLFPVGIRAQDSEQADPFMMEDLQDYYGDEAFVTIATGSRKPIYKAPAVATVITAEEIKAMGARNLDDVLETVAGIHVSVSSLNRLDSIYSIRGIHSGFNPHVLFLMDGVPFQDLWTGAHPILFRFPISSISRVEVIRGPGSAIYGADAFSGVINIVTKDAVEINGTETGVRRGSFDTTDFWLQHGGMYLGWDFGFSFEMQDSDGDPDRIISQDTQSFWDQFDQNLPNPLSPASLAPGPLATRYRIFDTHLKLSRKKLRLNLWNWRLEDGGVGAGGAQALDPEGSQSDNLYLFDIAWQDSNLFTDWDLRAQASYQYLKNDIHFLLLPPGTTVPIGPDGNIDITSSRFISFPDGLIGKPDSRSKIGALEATGVYNGFYKHRIRLGTGFRYQAFETDEAKNFGPGVIPNSDIEIMEGNLIDVSDTPFVYAPDESRNLWYLSLQDEWQFASDWELTAGVRYDYYSDFGDTINPRLALVWAIRHNLTSKLLYGRAFRAPSFSELYAINNPAVQGNRNLAPETIDTVELSFDYRPVYDLQMALSLFAYRAEDLIEFVPDSMSTTRKTAQNARDQEGYGLEFEMKWQVVHNLKVGFNYAWQHSEDVDSGQRIADAPGQQISLIADWELFPKWYFHPQMNWVADRKRAFDDARKEVNDYALVDITLRRVKFFTRGELTMSARNLFDEDVREPSDSVIPGDLPMEGRSYWIGFSWRI